MARVYRLQLNAKSLSDLRSTKTPVTEFLCFDTQTEMKEFLNDPEGFARAVGLITSDMPFNGLNFPKGISKEQLLSNLPPVTTGPAVFHDPSCQLGWVI